MPGDRPTRDWGFSPLHRVCGVDVQLAGRERAHPTRSLDHVATRGQLCDAVWGTGAEIIDRTIESHLRNLRAKLLAAGNPDAVYDLGVRLGKCQSV